MNKTKAQILLMKGAISELPPEEQEKINELKQKMQAITDEYPIDLACMAVALFSIEFIEKI